MVLIQASLILLLSVSFSILIRYKEKIVSPKNYSKFNIIRYALIFILDMAVLSLDYDTIGLILLNIGVFLNLIVLVFNNGYMPVDMNAFKKSLYFFELENHNVTVEDLFKEIQENRHIHIAMTSQTKFNFLGDKYGESVQSIGDIFIFIGHLLILTELIFLLFSKLI